MLTEAGSKKRAGVWLLTPEAAEAELAHLGPEALGLGAERLGEILRAESRRLHSLLRDQRVIAGHRPRLGERDPPHGEALAVRAVHATVTGSRSSGSPTAIDAELARGLELRERGANDKRTLPRPQASSASRATSAARRSRASTSRSTRSTTARECQTGGRVLKDRRLSRLLR